MCFSLDFMFTLFSEVYVRVRVVGKADPAEDTVWARCMTPADSEPNFNPQTFNIYSAPTGQARRRLLN